MASCRRRTRPWWVDAGEKEIISGKMSPLVFSISYLSRYVARKLGVLCIECDQASNTESKKARMRTVHDWIRPLCRIL